MELKDAIKSADWKKEKHVPAIDAPDAVKKGEAFKVNVTVGKEIAHPNTTEHHILWVSLFFIPDGEQFAYQIGRVEFASHGGSATGPNTSTVYSNSEAVFSMKTEKPGTFLAASYCNIHGLWQNTRTVKAA